MKPEMVSNRFRELPYLKADFWIASGAESTDFSRWLDENRARIHSGYAQFDITSLDENASANQPDKDAVWIGVIELYLTLDDHKEHAKRVLVKPYDKTSDDPWTNLNDFSSWARDYVTKLVKQYDLPNIVQGN